MATAFKNIPTHDRQPIAGYTTRGTDGLWIYYAQAKDYVDIFEDTVGLWRQQTDHLSLARDKVENAAFQQIVAMGDKVVPLIIEQLRHNQDLLFLALHKITGENPTFGATPGKINELIAAWILWAEQNDVTRG